MAGTVEFVRACFEVVVTLVMGSTGRLIPHLPATLQIRGAFGFKAKMQFDHRQTTVS
jgi:hypothetical protein